ncbi:MAG TPA: hypothetical protein PLF04_08180 [Candidatus Fermentibacter daniensis]|nr:MAG: hypothetical protein BWX47_00440 [candidate division Hyd24-12 bacterium ADurb.Bin004]HOZ18295.1 hypothetical protein [Candidatus Fermentibacter daniensis]HPH40197.1 hypothetical protein [Candidatus Fermentibacter daniensis]HPN63075.1 hypothetical protein [Candidatus Fermentibacter daniensis]
MKGFHPWNVSEEATRTHLELFRKRYASLYQVKDTFLPETVVAAYLANMLPGEPIWMIVVGPASSGKTATLDLIRGLDSIHEVSALTEAALLSGTPTKERGAEATGGLLCQIGSFGIILCKDFTTILSSNRDSLLAIVAAFREIHDGHYSRTLGVEGGRTFSWSGKVGFIGAATEVIDSKQDTRQQMGERFIMLRPESDIENSYQIAKRALRSNASDAEGIEELKKLTETLTRFFKMPDSLPDLPQEVADHLASLALIITRARSTTERHNISREIENVPQAEEPARLSKQLRMMFFGYLTIGCTDEEALERVTKLALDSMPLSRKRLLLKLYESNGTPLTRDLAEVLGGASKTAIRHLEDLVAYGLVRRIDIDSNRASWSLTDMAREHLEAVLAPITSLEAIPFSDDQQMESRTAIQITPSSINPPKLIPESRSECREKSRRARAG